MNKEGLFKKYKNVYMYYLCGKCSYHDTYVIIESIDSLAHKEAKSIDEIESIVKENNARISNIQKEVRTQYDEVTEPIAKELLDFLQFKGLVKSIQYKKKAKELKGKLQKYDGLFIIREKVLTRFFLTKIGSRYDDYGKMKLLLRLGALDIKNL